MHAVTHTHSGSSVGAFAYTNTCAHTVVHLWSWAAGGWQCCGVEHWLSVFSQVHLLNHSTRQQQTLNRLLVWVQLNSSGRAVAKSFDHAVIDSFHEYVDMLCGIWYWLCVFTFIYVGVGSCLTFFIWFFLPTPCFTYSHSCKLTPGTAPAQPQPFSRALLELSWVHSLSQGITVINIDRSEKCYSFAFSVSRLFITEMTGFSVWIVCVESSSLSGLSALRIMAATSM